jgi:cyclophilin family peptidyl-prolyl cis-trans isomerase
MEDIRVDTSMGSFTVELYPQQAPKACQNFTELSRRGYYDGVVFHRIIKDFMLQGGDPTGTGRGGESIWVKTVEDECHPYLTFERPGLLAMANAGHGHQR